LMARLRTDTGWERAIVPAFVYFFAQLYPFGRVRKPRSRVAAAAGGCVLLRRDTLATAGGLAAIAGALIDDVALASLVKRRGGGWPAAPCRCCARTGSRAGGRRCCRASRCSTRA